MNSVDRSVHDERAVKVIRRPSSLAEVARWTLEDGEFDLHLRDFLHEFAARQQFAMLCQEPALLCEAFADEAVRDAYLAATAAYLAGTIGREVPRWAFDDNRRARRAWFAAPDGDTLQMMLLHESPPEFRERNLFVSANALTIC